MGFSTRLRIADKLLVDRRSHLCFVNDHDIRQSWGERVSLLYFVYQEVGSIPPVSQRGELKTSPCEPPPKERLSPTTPMWGGRPGQVLSCVVVVWSTHRGGLVPRVYTERSDRPWVTLNLCALRRYNLGEGDLVSTLSIKWNGQTNNGLCRMTYISGRPLKSIFADISS